MQPGWGLLGHGVRSSKSKQTNNAFVEGKSLKITIRLLLVWIPPKNEIMGPKNFPTSHSFRKLFHQANQPSKKKTHANNTPPSKHETHLPTYQLNPPQKNKVIPTPKRNLSWWTCTRNAPAISSELPNIKDKITTKRMYCVSTSGAQQREIWHQQQISSFGGLKQVMGPIICCRIKLLQTKVVACTLRKWIYKR